MKIVLEGTEKQVDNLKNLLIEGGNLPTLRYNYQTNNLWSSQDVTDHYECSEDDALELLENALTNEATMEQIWIAIHFEAEEMELTSKNN
jgi:hypothetical protein